jgi:hypothetical protein
MLAVKNYTREYIDECRTRVDAQLARYRALVAAARDLATHEVSPLERAFGEFYPVFFNNQVVVLDAYFANRLRAAEGKDGNPANEVRVIAASVLAGDDRMRVDPTIGFDVAKTVLHLGVGDPIALDEQDFTALAAAFFAEIEKRYAA